MMIRLPRSLSKQFVAMLSMVCLVILVSAVYGFYYLITYNQHLLELSSSKSDMLLQLDSLNEKRLTYVQSFFQLPGSEGDSARSNIIHSFREEFQQLKNSNDNYYLAHLDLIENSWQGLIHIDNEYDVNQHQSALSMASEQLENHLKVFKQVVLEQINREQLTSVGEYQRNIIIIIALLGLTMIVGIWLVMRMVRNLASNLHSLGQGMAFAAIGDLSKRISLSGCSETEALSEGFNYMVEELERQNNEVKSSEQGLLAVMNSAPDAIVTTDLQGTIINWNNTAEQMFAYSLGEMSGENFQSILEPGQQIDFQDLLSKYGQAYDLDEHILEGPWEFSVRRRDSSHMSIEITLSGMILDKQKGMVIVGRDITERKAAEEKMAFLIQHDNLTHLPNRSLTRELLTQTMARADVAEQLVGVLSFGVDHFRDINDHLGHTLADGLLVALADRINDNLSRRDHFGRIGGDEFCIIIDGMNHVDEASIMAERIANKLTEPFKLGGQEVYVTLSMGISIYPFDDESPEILLKHASTAMYRCKRDESWQYLFYSEEMNSISTGRVKLTAELKNALDEKQFLIYYQPQYNLNFDEIIGAEALLRWQHPERGMLGPAEYIPILEDSGLIVPLGLWMMAEVMQKVVSWNKNRRKPLRLSINLSARQLKERSFIEDINKLIKIMRTELLNNKTILNIDDDLQGFLELELTEGMLMENTELTRNNLFSLKELGINLSVDDFGTGYSSLSYLQRFPIDALKIDQSFVQDIGISQDAELIVHAIIDLAHNLRLKVIGEGIETQQHLNFLSDKGCDEGQGFWFSEPVSANDMEKLL